MSGRIPLPRRFAVVACGVLWREIAGTAAALPHSYDLRFLRQGLHNSPELLRSELQAAVDGASAAVAPGLPADKAAAGSSWSSCAPAPLKPEAILVGYGLCSNGLAGIEARDVPLVAPRAHDCLTFLLGSKERYREIFDAGPGTYWYSPGWIETGTQPGRERTEALRREYRERYGEENADYLMEMEQDWMKKYNTCAYVSLGGFDDSAYRAYSRECAEYMGWTYREPGGDPGLLRDFLAGEWDDERFIVVPPGRRIAASFDESIVELERPSRREDQVRLAKIGTPDQTGAQTASDFLKV